LSRDALAVELKSGYHTGTSGVHVPTKPSVSRDRVFRFGSFELSEREGELRKSGVRIKLQDQPFRVLVELVANAGSLVSREDLHQKLWPSDTFVDFDVGLNSAIRKLRQALNDDSDHPHYIETLAKRGYRFLAPVSEMGGKSAEQHPQLTPDGATASDASLLTSSVSASPVRAERGSTQRWIWIAVAAVAMAIAAALVFWWNRPPPAAPVVEAVTQLTDDGEPKPYKTKIVTDGVRVYFNEGTIGSQRIAQVAVTGGSVAAIPTTVVAPRIVGLAPEGSALLVVSGGIGGGVPIPLWQIPLPTGEPRRLGTIEVQDASFFPDGRILYALGGDLYVAEKDGSNPRKLVSVEGVIRQPSISPDGQRLVFTNSGYQFRTTWIVESMADGSGLQQIVNATDSGRVCCAQWSPDGNYILFQNHMKADGTFGFYR
jgi:DNA-binding winged helix-turn-helix (wHTH) protein